MKNLKVTNRILTIAFCSPISNVCKDLKKKAMKATSHHTEMEADGDHSEMNTITAMGIMMVIKRNGMSGKQDGIQNLVLNDYFNLKNALVGDANGKAKELEHSMAQR